MNTLLTDVHIIFTAIISVGFIVAVNAIAQIGITDDHPAGF